MYEYAFEFTAKLKHHQFGRSKYTVAYLPAKLIKSLPLKKHPRLRIDGELNGVRFANALHPASGKWYLLVPRRLQKQCDVTLGDRVFVQFDIADQDAVEVPEELTIRFGGQRPSRSRLVWPDAGQTQRIRLPSQLRQTARDESKPCR